MIFHAAVKCYNKFRHRRVVVVVVVIVVLSSDTVGVIDRNPLFFSHCRFSTF